MVMYKDKIVGASIPGTGTDGGNVYSDEVHSIKVLSRAEYLALEEKQPDILYLIRG